MKRLLIVVALSLSGVAYGQSMNDRYRIDPPRQQPRVQQPAIDARTGQPYPPAAQGFVDSNGVYYAPAGPNAVVNTQTGQVIPIVPRRR